MIRVAFTTYPQGQPERTVWTSMPQVPRVGDSVGVDDLDFPVVRVTHVRWVQGRGEWWADLSVTASTLEPSTQY